MLFPSQPLCHHHFFKTTPSAINMLIARSAARSRPQSQTTLRETQREGDREKWRQRQGDREEWLVSRVSAVTQRMSQRAVQVLKGSLLSGHVSLLWTTGLKSIILTYIHLVSVPVYSCLASRGVGVHPRNTLQLPQYFLSDNQMVKHLDTKEPRWMRDI